MLVAGSPQVVMATDVRVSCEPELAPQEVCRQMLGDEVVM